LSLVEAAAVSQEREREVDPTHATVLTSFDPLAGLETQIDRLREVGAMFYQRGWSVGTSSNYSVVLDRDPLDIVITASGKDKGRLTRHDFVRIDESGASAVPNQPKASAETMLHVVIADQPDVGAVLHTHSVWGTLLSDIFFADGGLTIEGYEMLKGLAGVETHEYSAWVEIFDNTQDIPELAARVFERLNDAQRPLRHGFLIRRHGLYTWGKDVAEARRHVEIFEFLFECVARRLRM
jgi:methylthioribulose-1-phosphate dehydratase